MIALTNYFSPLPQLNLLFKTTITECIYPVQMRRLCDVHIRVKDDVMLRFNLTLARAVLKTGALAVSNIDHRPTLDTNRYVKCKGANYPRKRATKC